MIKELFILLLIFYFLVLVQTSFTVFLSFYGFNINFILILLIMINIFESSESKIGLLSAFIGGFLLDIWSSQFFGFWTLVCFLIVILIKFIKQYVKIPEIKKMGS